MWNKTPTDKEGFLPQIRISAKDLGAFAYKNSCPRCLWIRLHTRNKLPYQSFPGIFSSIDSYTKKFICSYFEKHGHFPDWLPSRDNLTGLTKKLHHSYFNILDLNTDIILSGVPDEIFTLKDNSYFILDYKTARYTEKQDTLLPVYEVQLNGYAYIAESKGLSPVKNIALAYMEPQTGLSQENVEEVITEEGFLLPFSGKIVMLELKLDIIPGLLKKVRNLYNQPSPPPGREECNDCQLLGNLIDILTQSKDKNA